VNSVNPVKKKKKKSCQNKYKMEHKELTKKILGCAYRVYNKMEFGFLGTGSV